MSLFIVLKNQNYGYKTTSKKNKNKTPIAYGQFQLSYKRIMTILRVYQAL